MAFREDSYEPRRFLWIGTEGGGLNKRNLSAQQFKRYEYSQDGTIGLAGSTVYAISPARDGNLWIGTERGLNAFSPDSVIDNQCVPPIIFSDFQIFNTSVPIGKNKDGLWNERGTSLAITVIPPVWNTLWFQILGTLQILSTIFTAHQIRTTQITKEVKPWKK
jgi:ligand-binding sensor domain-containing protein